MSGMFPGFPTFRVLVTSGMRDDELPLLVCTPETYHRLCEAAMRLNRDYGSTLPPPDIKP